MGGTSPFGLRKQTPVYIEESILGSPKIVINSGRRGYLVGNDPRVCAQLLALKPVNRCLGEWVRRRRALLVLKDVRR